MKIHALTVCVNYSDWLEYSAERWMRGLSSWTIVSDFKDRDTEKLARVLGANFYQTNAFYEDGASFNKGRALEEARIRTVPREGWLLLLDADVVPPIDWARQIEIAELRCGFFYGARRVQCANLADIDSPHWPNIPDAPCDGGYFQMFHSSDIHAQDVPLIETDWSHAGVYDSHLKMRWPAYQRIVLPLRLVHLGPQENWCGRGNKEAFDAMVRERRRTGSYQQERIKK